MPPYTHILTHGTGMFVRQHSIPAFLERYDPDDFMSARQIYDLFLGTMRHGEYASDIFFDQSVLHESRLPQIARTGITRVAVDIDDTIFCKDYTTVVTYDDVVRGIDIPQGYVWNVFVCQTSRSTISHQTVDIVSWDKTVNMFDRIPRWDGKTFRTLIPLPMSDAYALIRMNSRVLNKWILEPVDDSGSVSGEQLSRSISKYFLNPYNDMRLDVRYIYTYGDPYDSSLIRMNSHVYVSYDNTESERTVRHDDFVERDIDTSGLLSVRDMYDHVIEPAHDFNEVADYFSIQRQTFLSFIHECYSTPYTSYQRFKVSLNRSSEIVISYYLNTEFLESETFWPEHRFARPGQGVVHFSCQYIPEERSYIDTVMEKLQRLDILIPNMFNGRPYTIQERILQVISDRSMHHPPCTESDTPAVTRATRLINESDVLYEYQKENIRWMIRQEFAIDGMVGLFAKRVTGDPNGPGVFRRLFPETSFAYVKNPGGMFTSGGFLCDDVGMGKTRQIIELVRATSSTHTIATLIIVPPNVIDQWRREIEMVWTDCRLAIFHGKYKRAVDISSYERTRQYNIVLTTPRMETSIPNSQWERIVIDESHIIKGASHRHTAGKKWLVTATPYTKMLDQLHWLVGHSAAIFYKPEEPGYSSYPRWPYDSNPGFKRQYVLFHMLMTRKTREVHALLPPVETTRVIVPLSEDDRTHYRHVVEHVQNQHVYSNYVSVMHAASTLSSSATLGPRFVCVTDQRSTHRCFADERRIDPNDVPNTELCPICITNVGTDAVRTVCNHWFCEECLSMCLSTTIAARCPMCRGDIPSKSVQMTIQPVAVANDENVPEHTTYVSAKMQCIMDDIRRHRSLGKSVLVFFNHKEQMPYVSSMFDDASIEHMCVHGGMHVERRNRVFSLFQERAPEARVLLTTTKCASAGLTLTSADVILLVSPADDASTEEQIIGRARRIGRPHDQPIEFHVYVSEGTIEESIYTQRQTHRTANVWDITREIIM